MGIIKMKDDVVVTFDVRRREIGETVSYFPHPKDHIGEFKDNP